MYVLLIRMVFVGIAVCVIVCWSMILEDNISL